MRTTSSVYYKLRTLGVLAVTCLQFVGCNRQSAAVSSDAPILKIVVMADGRITVDGSPATMESLRMSLKGLAERKGVVWYYRESGQKEPPRQAVEVVKAVIENRLPIRLSSRPDYSDAIGMDGKPIAK